MRRGLFSLLIGAALLAGIPAEAFWQSRDSHYNLAIAAASGYQGPGDIVSGATAWFGLRAYNAAYAATPGLSVNVRRASDNVACDFLVASSGGFGVTTATCNSSTQGGVSFGTFVGSDGTASCTLAGTTGACTGASGTVHVNDVVTGTGLTQPCIVAAASNIAPTIEIAGTTTSCGTISVAETFTFQVAGFVTEAYDQSGSNACTSAPCNVTQATAGQQPQFLPACVNSLPCLYHIHASAQFLAVTITGITQPYTYSQVADLLAAGVCDCSAISTFSATGGLVRVLSGSPQIQLYNNTGLSQSISVPGWHTFQGVSNIVNSVNALDGTEVTGTTGSGGSGTDLTLGSGGAGTRYWNGYIGEGAFYPFAFTSGSPTAQTGAMCGNQATYYGTTIGANC